MNKWFILLVLLYVAPLAGAAEPAPVDQTWNFTYRDNDFRNALLDLRYLNEKEAGERGIIRLSDDGNDFVRDDGTSSVMQRLVPQILQKMEGFDKKSGQPVMFMGATNVPWQLDPAVLRPGKFDDWAKTAANG